MTCVRCGRCCFYLLVTIASKYIDSNINLENGDIPDDMIICIDGQETFCPYLSWDDKNDMAVCEVHDKPWYKQTGCYKHNNPEFENFPCRIGQYLRLEKNKKYMDQLRSQIQQLQKQRKLNEQ